MKRNTLLALLCCVNLNCFFQSCMSQYDILLNGNDYEKKYTAAFEYFNKGKYEKSSQLFESLSFVTSGTAREDTLQYYLALSNYRNEDYVVAETDFSRFLENFPKSPFAQDASFLRVDCLFRMTYRYELDQKPTILAINAIDQYMRSNPNSVHNDVCLLMLKDLNYRLDKKAYENAKLYYKMEDYKAAIVCFRNVLKDNSENVFREEILYYLAKSSYKFAQNSIKAKQKERYLAFIDDYFNFIGENPKSTGHKKDLESLYKRVQKETGLSAKEENSEKNETSPF